MNVAIRTSVELKLQLASRTVTASPAAVHDGGQVASCSLHALFRFSTAAQISLSGRVYLVIIAVLVKSKKQKSDAYCIRALPGWGRFQRDTPAESFGAHISGAVAVDIFRLLTPAAPT
ncbi:MAG: hypothetical protein ACT4SY_14130 [Hyphomicrobiales bacterium]